jgi:hypothetical protein
MIERRDAVDRDSAPGDLVEPDRRFRFGSEEHDEARVELCVEPAFEVAVLRMGCVGQAPGPLAPPLDVLAERLPRLLLQELREPRRRHERSWIGAARALNDVEQIDEHRGVAVAPRCRDLRLRFRGLPPVGRGGVEKCIDAR